MFFSVFVAHILGDFYFQCEKFCNKKVEEAWYGKHKLIHALIIFVLTWIATLYWCGWWMAAIISVTHWVIDVLKSIAEKKITLKDEGEKKVLLKESRYQVVPFIFDQVLHIVIIILLVYFWGRNKIVDVPEWIKYNNADRVLHFILFLAIAHKPANIFIKLVLRYCQVNTKIEEEDHGLFRSGALIGTIERWLILSFVVLGQYEAIGFLLAAKSILRFKEANEGEKSEYVLAGTFLSVAIALFLGVVMTRHSWNSLIKIIESYV